MASDRTAEDIRYAIRETESILTELRSIAEKVKKSADNVGEDKCYQALTNFINNLQTSVNYMRKVVG